MSNVLNVDEYGEDAIIDVGEDISTNTNWIAFKDPNGKETTKSAIVGIVNYSSSIGNLLANQYLIYTIEKDLIDVRGRWYYRAISEGAGKRAKTNWLPFDVKA